LGGGVGWVHHRHGHVTVTTTASPVVSLVQVPAATAGRESPHHLRVVRPRRRHNTGGSDSAGVRAQAPLEARRGPSLHSCLRVPDREWRGHEGARVGLHNLAVKSKSHQAHGAGGARSGAPRPFSYVPAP
jgi:hypothetical protein